MCWSGALLAWDRAFVVWTLDNTVISPSMPHVWVEMKCFWVTQCMDKVVYPALCWHGMVCCSFTSSFRMFTMTKLRYSSTQGSGLRVRPASGSACSLWCGRIVNRIVCPPWSATSDPVCVKRGNFGVGAAVEVETDQSNWNVVLSDYTASGVGKRSWRGGGGGAVVTTITVFPEWPSRRGNIQKRDCNAETDSWTHLWEVVDRSWMHQWCEGLGSLRNCGS